jgi:hypothetical protein
LQSSPTITLEGTVITLSNNVAGIVIGVIAAVLVVSVIVVFVVIKYRRSRDGIPNNKTGGGLEAIATKKHQELSFQRVVLRKLPSSILITRQEGEGRQIIVNKIEMIEPALYIIHTYIYRN